jgi:hypothetical protein
MSRLRWRKYKQLSSCQKEETCRKNRKSHKTLKRFFFLNSQSAKVVEKKKSSDCSEDKEGKKTMLDFYQNLNINTGMLQDQCPEKNSLACGQAGKVTLRVFIVEHICNLQIDTSSPTDITITLFAHAKHPQSKIMNEYHVHIRVQVHDTH